MDRLLRAPSWVIGLLTGVPFGIAIAVMVKLSSDTTIAALIFGAASGLVVGAILALGGRKQRREMRQVLERLPFADWKAARTAAWHGPVPTRPDVRATALDLVDLRLRRQRKARTLMVVVIGLNLALALVNVVATGRWWYLILAAMWTAGLVDQWHSPRRFQRRRELLLAAD